MNVCNTFTERLSEPVIRVIEMIKHDEKPPVVSAFHQVFIMRITGSDNLPEVQPTGSDREVNTFRGEYHSLSAGAIK
jgi:hypothetical protein